MSPLELGEVTVTRVIEIDRSSFPTLSMLPDSTPDAIARHHHWLRPHFWDDRTGDVGADARAEVAGPVVPEVRPEPVVVARDHVWRCVREHGQGRERRAVELDDAADGDVAKRERAHANRGITFSPNRRMDLTIRSWGTPPRLNDPMRYVRPRAS